LDSALINNFRTHNKYSAVSFDVNGALQLHLTGETYPPAPGAVEPGIATSELIAFTQILG